MIEGAKISLVHDDQPPLKSGKTRMIAAALAADCQLFGESALIDAFETKDGSEPKRSVTWMFDAGKLAHFSPAFAEESISFVEFARRFESLEWCEANPHHPISYMRGMSKKLDSLRDRILEMKPGVLIRKGKRTALIPAECEPERRAEILAQMG